MKGGRRVGGEPHRYTVSFLTRERQTFLASRQVCAWKRSEACLRGHDDSSPTADLWCERIQCVWLLRHRNARAITPRHQTAESSNVGSRAGGNSHL